MSKALVIVYSYHHNNTKKVADAIAKKLNADVRQPDNIKPEELARYDLIGFGAGIDSGKHYKPILNFATTLPLAENKKAFIFSTSAIMGDKKVLKDHLALREILAEKGYVILDEFACKGFNTNSFLKYLGGMNKGKPNADDLRNAEVFAEQVLHKANKL